MARRQPGEQLARLGLLRAAVGELLDQVAGGGPHAALVLHRDPQVIKDAAQVGGEALGVVDVPELDVDPRLADRVRVGLRRAGIRMAGAVRRSRDVAVDAEHRVHDQQDVGAVPVELHRYRVDQVRHVVGDDVDNGLGPGQPRCSAARVDADGRAALRAARPERGVLRRGGGQPGRPRRDQVIGGDEPVVRGEEARQVADRPAQVPRRRHASVGGGPLARRLGDQFLPGVVRDLTRSRPRVPALPVHSFVMADTAPRCAVLHTGMRRRPRCPRGCAASEKSGSLSSRRAHIGALKRTDALLPTD